MFIYNSNDSDKSTFSKIIKVLMAIVIAWQLIVQVYSGLAFTRTKIGSKIRKGFLHVAMDYMDDSMDVLGERIVPFTKKLTEASHKVTKAIEDAEAEEEEE